MVKIDFSVFDHLDASGEAMSRQYTNRLKLAQACESAGFRAYHVAEHHGTPHGIAPSPNLFLSALAQRTTRLRLGPLVMLLNLYHPLRAFEEICMLDQMSGGRLELGFGSGMALELGFFGVGAEAAQDRYHEASEIILKAMAGGKLSYQGRHFDLQDVPIELSPFQHPHPPLWVGVMHPASAISAAENGLNMACVGSVAGSRCDGRIPLSLGSPIEAERRAAAYRHGSSDRRRGYGQQGVCFGRTSVSTLVRKLYALEHRARASSAAHPASVVGGRNWHGVLDRRIRNDGPGNLVATNSSSRRQRPHVPDRVRKHAVGSVAADGCRNRIFHHAPLWRPYAEDPDPCSLCILNNPLGQEATGRRSSRS